MLNSLLVSIFCHWFVKMDDHHFSHWFQYFVIFDMGLCLISGFVNPQFIHVLMIKSFFWFVNWYGFLFNLSLFILFLCVIRLPTYLNQHMCMCVHKHIQIISIGNRWVPFWGGESNLTFDGLDFVPANRERGYGS